MVLYGTLNVERIHVFFMGEMLCDSQVAVIYREPLMPLRSFMQLYAAVLAESIWNKHEMQSANIEQVQ